MNGPDPIPASPPRPAARGSIDAAPLLVVDDDPSNLLVLGELLEGEHAVRFARSGEQALALAR